MSTAASVCACAIALWFGVYYRGHEPLSSSPMVHGLWLSTKWEGIDPTDTRPISASNPEVREDIRESIAASRTMPLLRSLVDRGVQVSVSVSLFTRGLDGPGSSQDLPLWQKKLSDRDAPQLHRMPKTCTIASAFKVQMHFTVSKGRSVEYVAPQYGLSDQKPRAWPESVPDFVPKSQADAPGFVFHSLMGWKGMKVRVYLDKIDVMAKEGGMGSSGAFNAGLLAGASMLTGAGLSEGDIFALGTKIENAEFGGLTGGQELLSSLLGGAMQHVWLFGIARGYSAFTIPITDNGPKAKGKPDLFGTLSQYALYVQAGKTYTNGTPEVHRTAAAVNTMWTDLLIDQDAQTVPVLARMKELSGLYASSLESSNMSETVKIVNEFVDLRIQMGHRWLELLHQAAGNIEKLVGSPAWDAVHKMSIEVLQAKFEKESVPVGGLKYTYEVWDPKNAAFIEFSAIRGLYQKLDEAGDLARLHEHDFYVFGPVKQLLERTRAAGDIAIMPLGAGGPGANLIAVTSNFKGTTYLKEVLASLDIPELDETEVSATVKATGTIRGWMPFTVGSSPWNATVHAVVPDEMKSDDKLQAEVRQLVKLMKTNRPRPPGKAIYNPNSGRVEAA